MTEVPCHEIQIAVVEPPFSIDLSRTVLSHGWVNLSPWTWLDQVLARPERLSHGTATVAVRQPELGRIEISVRGVRVGPVDVRMAITRVRRWLSLDWNPHYAVEVAQRIDPQVAAYISGGGGRFLRGSTFYEDLVKTICTINASWAYTQQMASRLVELIGGGTFPSPEQMLEHGETTLLRVGRVGYRAEVIIRATEHLLEAGVLHLDGRADEDMVTPELLGQVKGIGPYATDHLRVLLHDFSSLPIDSEVRSYAGGVLGLRPEQIQAAFAEWGPYAFLGYKAHRTISNDNWLGE